MATAVSPLAPARVPDMPPIAGVRLATAAAGINYAGRTDVLLALLDPGTAMAGVLTRSKCPSAPVDWCRARLKAGKARALVVNSGNANAFTGKTGRAAATFTAKLAAKAIGCKPDDVFLASTGVIGEPLQAEAFDGVMEGLVTDARARPLAGRRQSDHDHRHVSQGRDRDSAKIGKAERHDQRHRQGRRHDRARHGDDAVLRVHRRADRGAGAAGAARGGVDRQLQRRDGRRRHLDVGHAALLRDRRRARAARRASRAPPTRACGVPRGARTRARATSPSRSRATAKARASSSRWWSRARRRNPRRGAIALSIANSPLVKTAIAGEDANWGRVVMAVGKAGEPADRDRLSIWFGGIRVAHRGLRDPAYDEATVSAAMKKPVIALKVALGIGRGRDRV